MFRTTYWVIIISSISLSAIGQSNFTKRDFNNDGIIDQLSYSIDGGSSLSFTNVRFIDGKSKKDYEFTITDDAGSFISICRIPDVLGHNGSLSLGSILWGKNDTIESSLKWLLDALSNKIEFKNPEFADFTFKYNPSWILGEPKIPSNYFSILNNRKYSGLLKNLESKSELDSKFFWVKYLPENHKITKINRDRTIDSFKFSVTIIDSGNVIYRSPHGVILKKKNEYSWAFINDSKLFDANEKLRWPSVLDAQMVNKYLLIRQKYSTIVNLFILDPFAGQVLRVNRKFAGLDSFDELVIDNVNRVVNFSDSYNNNFSIAFDSISSHFSKYFNNTELKKMN